MEVSELQGCISPWALLSWISPDKGIVKNFIMKKYCKSRKGWRWERLAKEKPEYDCRELKRLAKK